MNNAESPGITARVALCTTSSEGEADSLAETLVAERLAACVQIFTPIKSVYRWRGKICSDTETLLVIKTESAAVASLKERIAELHSYDVPELIVLPVSDGLPDYLSWLAAECG